MSAPVEQRVNDLLARIDLSEKVHQLIQYGSQDLWDKADSLITAKAQEKLGEGIGMLEPPELSLPPARVARRLNAAQKYLVEKTRLGIPAFIYGEGLHGYGVPGRPVSRIRWHWAAPGIPHWSRTSIQRLRWRCEAGVLTRPCHLYWD